jgi:hypothetical protein
MQATSSGGGRYWNLILPQIRERGLLELLADTLTGLGHFEALAGNLEAAMSASVDLHGYYLAVGRTNAATGVSLAIADMLLDQGKYSEAIRWYDCARSENQAQPSAALEGFALRGSPDGSDSSATRTNFRGGPTQLVAKASSRTASPERRTLAPVEINKAGPPPEEGWTCLFWNG